MRFIIALMLFFNLNGYCKDILVTTLRSGSHFLMYTINALTDKGFLYNGKNYPFIGENECNPYLNRWTHQHKANINYFDRAVFAIRDYKELFLFYYANGEGTALDENIYQNMNDKKINDTLIKLSDYIHNLSLFDKHSNNKKLLIYYEDLIQNPKETIYKLADFIDVSKQKAELFLTNLEFHKARCIEKYNLNFLRQRRPYFHTHSHGKNISFYSNLVDEDILCEIDKKVHKIIPRHLFDKYLKRYSLID